MSFETDKQTLDDLNILGKYKNNSVYSLFSGTVTRGGEHLLENMFQNPLTKAEDINRRVKMFTYFKEHDLAFPGNPEECDVVEQYISGASGKHWIFVLSHLCQAKFLETVGHDPRYKVWQDQVVATTKFLKNALEYTKELLKGMNGHPLEERVKKVVALLEKPAFAKILANENTNPGLMDMFARDRLFRCVEFKSLSDLLTLFHELDVCTVVGRVARENDFCFPVASEDGEISMKMEALHHPCIPGAISNNMAITRDKNIFFLTGANMAGKSTLMKSFGIAVYMAHMGFPVAAKSMEFIVQDGMYTSINVPDNINMGYSHFYAEVLRVKKVAIEVSRSKKLVVIFDELFKGTNVKDAFDATLAVASALAKRRACSFLISTHIIEVGQELGKACDNVTFAYLPTVMDGKVPRYTYRLQPGITADKHGMIIINNEKIIETIRGEV